MQENEYEANANKLATIVAYYLSKFDKTAKRRLVYKTDAEAFQNLSLILGVKKNYIKFRRDEFDPIHPWRTGWTRPMNSRIIQTIETFQDLGEEEFGGLVESILFDSEFLKSRDLYRLVSLIDDKNIPESSAKNKFILRGPTGRKAEEFFINYHVNHGLPERGSLIDTRDWGCGYDFKITADENEFYIEVKGLSQEIGGILFTNKEWETAKIHEDKYFLALVSNVDSSPKINFLKNPTCNLVAKRNIVTTVQIQWSVKSSDLKYV